MLKSVLIDNYTIVTFTEEPDCAAAFLAVPKGIYPAKTNPQNPGDERRLLAGEHVLSKYFRFIPFLLQRGGQAIGRAALTIYPESPQLAYLGFFEMPNNPGAAGALFAGLESYARKQGCTRIMGPMNASFWLGYRMKADRFEAPPYFGEPYNPPYYGQLWQHNGYTVAEEYVSNEYHTLRPGTYRNKRYEQRLQKFLAAGYEFRPPEKDSWDAAIRDVYRLLSGLYSTFPGFSAISEGDFVSNYSGLKLILDFSLCRLVYWRGRAVAFAITVPDYGALLNDVQLWKLPQMLWKRRHSKRCVVLYVGVEPEHKGLGTAMMQQLIPQLAKRRMAPVGALIHKGKVTQGYAAGLIKAKNHYWLLTKPISAAAEEGRDGLWE